MTKPFKSSPEVFPTCLIACKRRKAARMMYTNSPITNVGISYSSDNRNYFYFDSDQNNYQRLP